MVVRSEEVTLFLRDCSLITSRKLPVRLSKFPRDVILKARRFISVHGDGFKCLRKQAPIMTSTCIVPYGDGCEITRTDVA